MSERMDALFLWSIFFNLFFSIFGFAFTNFNAEISDYDYVDITISEDLLKEYGIIFNNATSYNVTFNAPPVYYNIDNVNYRLLWDTDTTMGDCFMVQSQAWIEQYSDTWYFPEILFIKNASIVTMWNPEYNWLHIPKGTYDIFLTTINADNFNITKAVYETGILTATVGESTDEDFDAWAFIDWYWGMLFGKQDYGLPTVLGVFVKVITVINIIGFINKARELTRV